MKQLLTILFSLFTTVLFAQVPDGLPRVEDMHPADTVGSVMGFFGGPYPRYSAISDLFNSSQFTYTNGNINLASGIDADLLDGLQGVDYYSRSGSVSKLETGAFGPILRPSPSGSAITAPWARAYTVENTGSTNSAYFGALGSQFNITYAYFGIDNASGLGFDATNAFRAYPTYPAWGTSKIYHEGYIPTFNEITAVSNFSNSSLRIGGPTTSSVGVDIGPLAAIPASQIMSSIGIANNISGEVNGNILIIPRTSTTAASVAIYTPQNGVGLRVNGNGTILVPNLAGVATRIATTSSTGVLGAGIDVSDIYSPSNPQPTNWTQSGNNIYSNNTGNVGIGITNPTEKLHVEGGRIRVRDVSSDHQLVVSQASSSTSRKAGILYQIDAVDLWKTYVDNSDGNRFKLDGNGVNALSVNASNRNVGIGTTNPTEKLHVNGGALISSLAGVDTRIVTTSSTGVLGTTAMPTPDNLGNHTATQNLQLGTNQINNDGGANEGLSFATNGDATFQGAIDTELPDFRTSSATVTFSGNDRKVTEVYAGDGDNLTGSQIPAIREYAPTAHYTETVIASTIGTSQHAWSGLSSLKGNASQTQTQAHVAFNVPSSTYMSVRVSGFAIDAAGIPHHFEMVGAVEGGSITDSSTEIVSGMNTMSWYTTSGGDTGLRINAITASDWSDAVIEIEKVYQESLVSIDTRLTFQNSNL